MEIWRILVEIINRDGLIYGKYFEENINLPSKRFRNLIVHNDAQFLD